MKILHSGGFSPTELQNFRSIVHSNILLGMKDLCLLAIDELNLELESANRKKGNDMLLVLLIPVRPLLREFGQSSL